MNQPTDFSTNWKGTGDGRGSGVTDVMVVIGAAVTTAVAAVAAMAAVAVVTGETGMTMLHNISFDARRAVVTPHWLADLVRHKINRRHLGVLRRARAVDRSHLGGRAPVG